MLIFFKCTFYEPTPLTVISVTVSPNNSDQSDS